MTIISIPTMDVPSLLVGAISEKTRLLEENRRLEAKVGEYEKLIESKA